MKQQLLAALADPNVRAFLRVIRTGETHATNDEAYRALFGWIPGNGKTFSSFADHPRQAIKSKWGWTSAAGAYQAMCAVPGAVKTDTWGDFIRACGPHDFTPASQDLFAVWCINRRGALADVIAGRFADAVQKCAKEWASLPGSPYGQPVMTMDRAYAAYREAGGLLRPADTPAPVEVRDVPATPPAPAAPPVAAPELQPAPAPAPAPAAPPTSAPTQEKPMAPFIAAALPAIIGAVPALGRLFSSGSATAERNIKAAEVVVGIAQEALGARNAQEVAERVQADPAAAQVVQAAVQARWFELQEVGGGIEAARKAEVEFVAAGGDIKRSPSFWIGLALLPLVYMIVANTVGVIGKPLSDEVRSAISNGVVGLILGGLCGYYFGQTTSRNRSGPAN